MLGDFDVDFNALLDEIHGSVVGPELELRTTTGAGDFRENHFMDIISSV